MTTTTIEEEMTREEESTFEPIQITAVEGRVNADNDRIKVYTAEIPADVVANFYAIPAEVGGTGFQRRLDLNRVAQIGRIQGGDKRMHIEPMPNVHGGLLAYAEEDDITIERRRGGTVEMILRNPLRLIDGQHRAAGAKWALERGESADYTETVRIVVGATRPELATWYLRTNIMARKVQPSNIILNAAQMSGSFLKRKSWVARAVIALSQTEPLMVNGNSLVSFYTRDGGKIGAGTLYRVVDTLLPSDFNKEGPEAEKNAVTYVWEALDLYSRLVPNWGAVNETGEFESNDAYSFTSLVAFAHLYSAVKEQTKEDAESLMGRFRPILPFDISTVGSGEKAAVAIAAFGAGQMDIELSGVVERSAA